MKNILIIICFIVPLTLLGDYVPSDERADPAWRKKTDIDGNNTRATIFNTGLTGRQNFGLAGQTPYEWPKNTGRHYIAMTQIFVGGEVVDTSGRLVQIVDVPYSRTGPEGQAWTIEPVPGYCNGDSTNEDIAKSDLPGSWPDYWPDKMDDLVDPGWKGSWNGYFGKNIFNADQEMFFRASDDLYDRYAYYPHGEEDPSRRGLGVLIDCRVMSWSQVLVSDVIYLLYEIKNDSYFDLAKTAFCVWIADMVGGDGDTNDDSPLYDLVLDIAWCKDADNISKNPAFAGVEVGVAGIAFLETPGNAIDGIDNDGDGEEFSPKITSVILEGEDPTDLIDNNGNGLIDENETHVPFADQLGVGFRDNIDNDDDGEANSPKVTQEMLEGETPLNGFDDNENGLYDEGPEDVGKAFKDKIDNDDDGEANSPRVTREMLSGEISGNGLDDNGNGLVDEDETDVGKFYADGLDNDEDGAIDEGIDEGIDEMIDESREDGIDNDGDWRIVSDDVGRDGQPFTGDYGEGDGVPTSGAKTFFPGEPNIDKTDVSESDQIGLTNVQYVKMGDFHNNQDRENWEDLMVPGQFFDVSRPISGDWDAFVSSGFFPIKAGAVERISMAVILGQNDESVIRKKKNAQQTYDTDYQFAKAPYVPELKAVAGDGYVKLYWDHAAEGSFDDFLAELGEDPYDFEGYRLYRTTDPGRLDDYSITDAFGEAVYHKPIKVWDLVDGWEGLHPIHHNGAHFYLGENSGLVHSYIDSSVQNGVAYYYALTSFDYGSVTSGIMPGECPVMLSMKGGEVRAMGKNVQVVTPSAPAAGFVPASADSIRHVNGSANGAVSYLVMDQDSIRDGHTYQLIFEDTIVTEEKFDKFYTYIKTKNFSVLDVTEGGPMDTLINRSTAYDGDENPVVNGIQLTLMNHEEVEWDQERTYWSDTTCYDMNMRLLTYPTFFGIPKPSDYKIIFDTVGVDTSVAYEYKVGSNSGVIPAIPVNFKVYNITEKKFVDFAFMERDKEGGEGKLTTAKGNIAVDKIIFYEEWDDSLQLTWMFECLHDSLKTYPHPGDTAYIYTQKPFTSVDVYEFTMSNDTIDKSKAKDEMKRIKVVPNPYIISASWEKPNPYNSGRGPQEIHFIHLPAKCTIRIYTVSGELVTKIEHDKPFRDGTAAWNLLSLDQLAVSYGLYVYHVDAPGVGEKIGKFAIIK